MPDPGNTNLIEFSSWTLRIREASQQPSRLMLLIHGLTGDENSMWVFARNMPAQYWMVAPRGTYKAQPSGYSWRDQAPSSPSERPSLDQLRTSADALIRLVDEYAASVRIDASTFDLMGFSQGAAMSNVLAFLYPQRVRKVGILAGFVPSGLEELAPRRPLEGKPFFVTHGTKDETVPVDRARTSIAILEEAGAQVTYCEDDVAHKVSVTCLRALHDFFTD
ncbi:MAG TPA: PHB depolymerase family esterase [Anaerolineales bacterium]|nr:PHB depolymerase family esterase [Anaerolineales bacterium]